jgi:hypothetical protein
VTRRELTVVLGDLRLRMLPNGRVRVEPAGVLAHPDMDVPVEEYPSLGACLAAHGRAANDTAPPTPRPLSPAAEARLVDLPDVLRAWAREDGRVRLCLGHHVRDGVPLVECLANVVRVLGDGGLAEVRRRLVDCDNVTLRAWLAPHPVPTR